MSTDIVGKIVEYESGEMSMDEIIEFFADLIKSGMAWQLQGSYGRTAASLIEAGYITEEGEINVDEG